MRFFRRLLDRFGHRFCAARLHIGNGRPARLAEMDRRAHQQRPQQQVRQRQHHVEILAHVTVVQQVMPVQPEENPRALHRALPRQMHAPVDVFIRAVIGRARDGRPERHPPMSRSQADQRERHRAQQHQHRPVPPRHGNRLRILPVDQMVRLVRPENMMMHERVRFERITEFAHRPVHHIAVQRPFVKRGINGGAAKTDRHPDPKLQRLKHGTAP